MNDDHTFRMILIVGILVILPIGIYHRIRSQATGESLDRSQEGLFILATFGLKVQPAIVRVVLDSFREQEALEASRQRALEAVERALAEEAAAQQPRRKKPRRKPADGRGGMGTAA